MCDYTRERLREREALITEQKFGLKKGEKNTRRRQQAIKMVNPFTEFDNWEVKCYLIMLSEDKLMVI